MPLFLLRLSKRNHGPMLPELAIRFSMVVIFQLALVTLKHHVPMVRAVVLMVYVVTRQRNVVRAIVPQTVMQKHSVASTALQGNRDVLWMFAAHSSGK